MAKKSKWIDISVPQQTGMVHWPGDPEPNFERISDIDQGAEANVTMCRMTSHTGTHLDAPCHFIQGEKGIDQFPLEVGIGVARIMTVSGASGSIGRGGLAGRGIQRGERILLKTRNSARRWDNLEFQPDFVALNSSGAEFLAEIGVSLIGVDYLSVGVYQGDGAGTHRILLGAGIWILEGLDLSVVNDGEYELICLPLRMRAATALPRGRYFARYRTVTLAA